MDQNPTPTNNSTDRDFFKPDEPVQSSTATEHPVNQDPGQQPVVSASPAVAPSSPESAKLRSYSWTASEFIAHRKNIDWYFGLAAVCAVISLLVWFMTRDLFLAVTVMLGVVVFGVYAGRHPRQQSYSVDDAGLTIGQRFYPYAEFGSFSVAPESTVLCIEFSPLKRFSQYTTIYITPEDEDKVASILSEHLPVMPPRDDMTDRLMRKIKF